jgi:hypothetical protein
MRKRRMLEVGAKNLLQIPEWHSHLWVFLVPVLRA